MMTKNNFIQKSDAQRYTLGIVYAPDDVDCQGDYSDAKEIEKACHGFMSKLQGQANLNKSVVDGILKALSGTKSIEIDITDVYDDIKKGALGYNHMEWPDDIGDIVENYIMPVDCEINGEQVKKGTWMMGVVWSPDYFEKIQKGEITGYSMGGSGRRLAGQCL